jgi:hypothetical protein
MKKVPAATITACLAHHVVDAECKCLEMLLDPRSRPHAIARILKQAMARDLQKFNGRDPTEDDLARVYLDAAAVAEMNESLEEGRRYPRRGNGRLS